MSIIALSTAAGTRYFRAATIGQARVMLAASLGMIAALNAEAARLPEYIMAARAKVMPDTATPSIGAGYIYDAWANSQEQQISKAGIRAMQKSGPEHIRNMYNPDNAKKTRIMNEARALLASMGIDPDD